MKRIFFYTVLTAAMVMSCGLFAGEKTITVFAAASTTDAMKEISKAFTAANGIKVRLNLASSGQLARQMEQGAKADFYLSASRRWGKYAKEKGLLDNKTIKEFMKNTLVIITPPESKLKPFEITAKTDLPAMFKGRLSIGDPRHVPAGKYAVKSLKYYKWYNALKPRFLPAKDVRSALMVVELGESEMGIVYSTDAKKSKKVKVVSVFPEASHPPIVYVCAVCKDGAPAAAKFEAFLTGPKGAAVLKKYGFQPMAK